MKQFYTVLLESDEEKSLGDLQMQYKLFDENDNLIESIEEYAYVGGGMDNVRRCE